MFVLLFTTCSKTESENDNAGVEKKGGNVKKTNTLNYFVEILKLSHEICI